MANELTLDELHQAAKELGLTLDEITEMYQASQNLGLGVSPAFKERLKAKPSLGSVAATLTQIKADAARGVVRAKLAMLLVKKLPPDQLCNNLLSTFKADELDTALELVDEIMAQRQTAQKSNDGYQQQIKESLDSILSMLTGRPMYDAFTSQRLNQPASKPAGVVSLYDAATSTRLNHGAPALSQQTKQMAGNANSLYDAMTSRVLNPDLPTISTKEIEQASNAVYDSFTSQRLNRDKLPPILVNFYLLI